MRIRIFTIASLVALSACSNSDAGSSQQNDDGIILAAPSDTDTLSNDLPESEVAAIIALGATGAERPPVDEHQHGGSHSGHSVGPEDQAVLDTEIEAAQAMIAELNTIEKVAARGYVLATAPSPGIGTHFVRWSQILEPFTPGNPSMLLFDQSKSPPVLVGYSYAVQSASEPEGFTGKADMWHRHAGICVALSGWVIRERSTGPDECEGSFIAGGDFWMLHAWIVPGWENRDGMFAPANPKLCPKDTGPDFLRCADQTEL
jgi:hypothetical protein